MSCKRCSIVGVNDDEGPPVPIPNTVVKLIGVENTWREAAREDRSMPTLKTVTFTVTVFYFGVFRRGNKSSVLPGEEKQAEQQKEGEPYASPVDVKTLLKTIPQHRKNAMTRSRVEVRVMG